MNPISIKSLRVVKGLDDVIIHKQNSQPGACLMTVILLDWSVRESFHALDWLSKQDAPRNQYELIWVELYKRVIPEVVGKVDTLITCGQKGLYQKHLGYNIGLLHSRGQVITICDSDAVFPPHFISSIINAFGLDRSNEPRSVVLMHHEWRTSERYPRGISDIEQLLKYSWADLWPNVGACVSVRKVDAIRFGGFDEHPSFRGNLCGPYDLGWRLVNAGIPEIWHDENVALWHFSHPDPPASYTKSFSWRKWFENSYPHIHHHALTAVEAFSIGRMLPLKENAQIHELRMHNRQIGTKYEEKYACMTGPEGFSKWEKLNLHLMLILEPFKIIIKKTKCYVVLREALKKPLKNFIGQQKYNKLTTWWRS